MDKLIITSQANGVFTITLNRIDKKNALNADMYRQLCQHLNDADSNPQIHCVLLVGNNQCFCAGNDLQDFMNSSSSDELVALQLIQVLLNFNKPLIAAVAGAAVGIGTTMLLHCDMVIAADNSKFKLPFAQLGLCPEAGSSLLLPQLIGHVKAFELMVLGETFSAEQALQYGIINQVCSAEQVISLGEKYAAKIAKLPQDAVLTSKKLLKQTNQSNLANISQLEAKEFVRLVQTPECKAILNSFLT